jgi:hypothetical protein
MESIKERGRERSAHRIHRGSMAEVRGLSQRNKSFRKHAL